jgi:hypothetical protein
MFASGFLGCIFQNPPLFHSSRRKGGLARSFVIFPVHNTPSQDIPASVLNSGPPASAKTRAEQSAVETGGGFARSGVSRFQKTGIHDWV